MGLSMKFTPNVIKAAGMWKFQVSKEDYYKRMVYGCYVDCCLGVCGFWAVVMIISDDFMPMKCGLGCCTLKQARGSWIQSEIPMVDLKPGYGLTERYGAVGFFVSSEEAKAWSVASGGLLLMFSVKVVDIEMGSLSLLIVKGYLGNITATNATVVEDGWLRIGYLC
ncbi:AMP-binding, conserved site-containing protein [Artemisia annua]|uniref:AMP-binding, conserved site-containing protein n=1 Tax=Artemisia annua TaxID=35608 RepID=A0A2U1LCT8_ARTAN|nr:AMP-binding, conserved site-containing protein [Artemisia annua]